MAKNNISNNKQDVTRDFTAVISHAWVTLQISNTTSDERFHSIPLFQLLVVSFIAKNIISNNNMTLLVISSFQTRLPKEILPYGRVVRALRGAHTHIFVIAYNLALTLLQSVDSTVPHTHVFTQSGMYTRNQDEVRMMPVSCFREHLR